MGQTRVKERIGNGSASADEVRDDILDAIAPLLAENGVDPAAVRLRSLTLPSKDRKYAEIEVRRRDD